MIALLLALVLLVDQLAAVSPTPFPILPSDIPHANFAWGFSGGGKEPNFQGKQLLIVDLDETSTEQIQDYRAKNHFVHCYFAVGTAETWRPDYDPQVWDKLALGRLPQFPDEFWLDLTKLSEIKALMLPRFQRASAMGCHGIEPDNTSELSCMLSHI